jgi:hypothetical protein
MSCSSCVLVWLLGMGCSLSGTYIGPAGAIVLAGGMATNCTVQQLHLARVGVGGVGTAALARSVTGHPALRLLDLSWNVGDVDEGYAKRDRLEELEAAQAKVWRTYTHTLNYTPRSYVCTHHQKTWKTNSVRCSHMEVAL